MKKIILFVLFACFAVKAYSQNTKLISVFEEKKLTINSASNGYLGGNTRQVIAFRIDPNHKRFFWKISCLRRNTLLNVGRKTLIQIASNAYSPGYGVLVGKITNDFIDRKQEKYENCDVYLLPSREDATKFLQQGNWDFRMYRKWQDVSGSGDYVDDVKGDIYLGFINTNKTIGLDIYVDVVIETY